MQCTQAHHKLITTNIIIANMSDQKSPLIINSDVYYLIIVQCSSRNVANFLIKCFNEMKENTHVDVTECLNKN